MLLTIAIVLFLLWILGFSFHILGGFIHIVLIIAIIVAIVHLLRGNKAL